jgi:hypothetical protein
MFYSNLRHTIKNGTFTTKSGKQKKAPTAKNGFHYITRTAHFAKHKEGEKVEFCLSGNMPDWAEKHPSKFWASADQHEIERGRTSTSFTFALPNNLTPYQRQKLALDLIQEITGEHKFPFTCAIHSHKSEIDGIEQPHLHLMISEKSTNYDDIYRPPKQFFKQYRPKNPENGGVKKLTADVLGFGKNYIEHIRELSETLINRHLVEHAPTKKVLIEGMEIEVPSLFNRLSNREHNKKFGTQLEDVPQIPRWKLRSSDPITRLEVEAQKQTIKAIRERNNKQIYSEYYDAEVEKRQKLAAEVETRRAAPLVPVAASASKQQVSAVSESFKFSDKLDVDRLEKIVSFDSKLLSVLQTVRDFNDPESVQKIKAKDVIYGFSNVPENKVPVYDVASAPQNRLSERFKENYTNYCGNMLNALETHYIEKERVFRESFSLNIAQYELNGLLNLHERHTNVLNQVLEPIKDFLLKSENEVFKTQLVSLENKEILINSVLEQAQQHKSGHSKVVQLTAQNTPKMDSQNRFEF